MTDQVIAITADEFETFITQPQHQDRRFELIYGEIIEKHMPTEEHGVIMAQIVIALGIYLKTNRIGRVGTEIRHRATVSDVRIPDISLTLAVDSPLITHGAVPRLPDLAVEVQSPDDHVLKLRAKAAFYLDNGCQLVWIVIPRHRLIEVYRPDHDVELVGIDGTLTGGDMLPGFVLPVREVFEGVG